MKSLSSTATAIGHYPSDIFQRVFLANDSSMAGEALNMLYLTGTKHGKLLNEIGNCTLRKDGAHKSRKKCVNSRTQRSDSIPSDIGVIKTLSVVSNDIKREEITISDEEGEDRRALELRGVRNVGKDHFAELFLLGRLIALGTFPTVGMAANYIIKLGIFVMLKSSEILTAFFRCSAADRAFIRAHGVLAVGSRSLNYPLHRYFNDPIEKFSMFDHILTYGVHPCDFTEQLREIHDNNNNKDNKDVAIHKDEIIVNTKTKTIPAIKKTIPLNNPTEKCSIEITTTGQPVKPKPILSGTLTGRAVERLERISQNLIIDRNFRQVCPTRTTSNTMRNKKTTVVDNDIIEVASFSSESSVEKPAPSRTLRSGLATTTAVAMTPIPPPKTVARKRKR
eukprot:gene3837-7639_t